MNKFWNIPSNWTWTTIAEITTINPRQPKNEIPDELLVSFVPMALVGAENGIIDVNNKRPYKEVKKGYTNFTTWSNASKSNSREMVERNWG